MYNVRIRLKWLMTAYYAIAEGFAFSTKCAKAFKKMCICMRTLWVLYFLESINVLRIIHVVRAFDVTTHHISFRSDKLRRQCEWLRNVFVTLSEQKLVSVSWNPRAIFVEGLWHPWNLHSHPLVCVICGNEVMLRSMRPIWKSSNLQRLLELSGNEQNYSKYNFKSLMSIIFGRTLNKH